MEGGHVHGHDEVRACWNRQFTQVEPHVDPIQIKRDERGRWVVEVHQVVRDKEGNLLLDTTVYHSYLIRDRLIERMDILHRTSPDGGNPSE